MYQPQSAYSPNWLIQAMVPDDLALLKPHLQRIELKRNQVLAQANQPIEQIYFPEACIVSFTATSASEGMTEVGIVGRDGMTGTAVLLGSDRSPFQTFVQVVGTTALRIAADDFRRLVPQSPSLQALLLRYVQTFLVQSAHNTMSNAHHQIEARLARWLLMCHDRIDGDEIYLTHEFMSMMIAAQRTGVTLSLHVLEGAGMIKSKRSCVVIRDRAALEQLAGDAYGTPEAEYRRLIGPFGRLAEAAIELDLR